MSDDAWLHKIFPGSEHCNTYLFGYVFVNGDASRRLHRDHADRTKPWYSETHHSTFEERTKSQRWFVCVLLPEVYERIKDSSSTQRNDDHQNCIEVCQTNNSWNPVFESYH